MRFTWDPSKAASNFGDHGGVSFEEAQETFADPRLIETFDGQHSDQEPRYLAIGLSSRRLMPVVFTEPDTGTIRIISAWKSTRKEKQIYEEK